MTETTVGLWVPYIVPIAGTLSLPTREREEA